jgi:hypothetical protein
MNVQSTLYASNAKRNLWPKAVKDIFAPANVGVTTKKKK